MHRQGAQPASRLASPVHGARNPRLDPGRLDHTVQSLFVSGLAGSLQQTYSCGQRQYLRFCESTNMQAVHAGEEVLCKFVAQLAQDGLKHHHC